jgi:WD40 repeat protein
MDNDDFDALLAEYDERLARGATFAPPVMPADPALRDRFNEARACVDLLESAFPRNRPTTLDRSVQATTLTSLFSAPSTIGRFVVRRELGRGGHGVVFLAFDPILKREVALKVPRPEILHGVEMRLRFRREAQAAARLQHPNLVPLHDAGEVGPVCYLVSEYCPGPTLSEWLRSQIIPVSPADAVRVIAPLADAVGYMHAYGVLHRDIKPGNVILQYPVGQCEDGAALNTEVCPLKSAVPRITDFGLARFAEDATLQTRTGAVLGTPGYMAPEQAAGEGGEVGPPMDVYALGVMLYELLIGRPPFQGMTDLETLRQVTSQAPVPPRRIRNDVPRDLDTIVLKCLEKEPRRRYRTACELADELRRYLEGTPIRSRPVGVVGRTARWCRRRPAAAALIGITATAMAALVIMALVRNRELSTYNANLERLNGRLTSAAREAQEHQQLAESHALRVSEGLYAAQMSQAAIAAREGDMQELMTLLDAWGPRPGEQEVRGFEYWYLRQQARQSHRVLLAADSALYILRRSPDGKTIAAGGKDGTVWLIDEATGAPVRTITTGQIEVNGIAFSPDGREVATAGDDGTIRIWDLASERERLCIHAHPEKAFQIVFARDGSSIVSCGAYPDIQAFDAHTGDRRFFLAGHTDVVQSLELDVDGQTLVSTSDDKTCRLWNLETQTQVGLISSNRAIGPVAISRNPPLVVTGNDGGMVEVRHLPDGRELGSAEHLNRMRALALHPDRSLLAAGDSTGSIQLWRLLPTGEMVAKQVAFWHAHRGGVGSLIWSPDGTRLLSAGNDGRVVRWSTPALLKPRPHVFLAGGIDEATLIPKTELLVAAGPSLTVWNWKTGAKVSTIAEEVYRQASVSSDGRLIAAITNDGILRVFARSNSAAGLSQYECVASWESAGDLTRVQIAPDSKTVAVARWRRREQNVAPEHAVWLLSLPDLSERQALPVESVNQMAFAPDSKHLALRARDGLAMWSRSANQILWQVAQSDAESLAFSSDGRSLISRIDGRGAIVRNARDGAEHLHFGMHRATLTSIVQTPDGRTLATAGEDGIIRLWHLATGRILFDLYHGGGAARIAGFSADGCNLICVVDTDSIPRQKQIVIFETANRVDEN